jgi:uracil-DNA glycosylase family 4
VDARERLRRYLEQRREMGESELVLDSLTVEEALRIVSGPWGPGRGDAAPEPSRPPASADWRETLRAAGGEPQPREPTRRVERIIGTGDNVDVGEPPLRARRIEASAPPPLVPRADARPVETPRSAPPIEAPLGITVGSDARDLFGGPLANLNSLEEIARVVHDCTRCPLYSTATNPVPGEGSTQAGMMIVGEAPGANEDATGRPFVGPAGQLLNKILGAVDLRREDVFICNVMKHRPPGNRNPTPDEVAACSPYLVRQIEVMKPKVILALGTFAAQTLLATKLSIGKLRGQVHRYHGVPLIVTYHPAALLRNPGWKRPTWEDVQLARRVLDRAAGGA